MTVKRARTAVAVGPGVVHTVECRGRTVMALPHSMVALPHSVGEMAGSIFRNEENVMFHSKYED